MRIFVYTILAVVFVLVTFFGLGPVVFADGSMSERIITLIVVLLLYLILGWVTISFTKRYTHSRNK